MSGMIYQGGALGERTAKDRGRRRRNAAAPTTSAIMRVVRPSPVRKPAFPSPQMD